MNRSKMFDIIKKELRDIIRDKKTLMMMIIIPLLLYPVMIGALSFMMESMADQGETIERNVGFTFEVDNTLASILNQSEIIKTIGTEEELKTRLQDGEILAYIKKEDNKFIICYLGNDNKSGGAAHALENIFDNYNKLVGSQILISEGLIPEKIFEAYIIESKDIADTSYGAEYMLSYIPSIIIMMATMTAGFAAIDMTAGEKERGTLETLLTFPIKKFDIIGGKFIANVICTSISSILGFVSMYTVLYVLSKKLEVLEGFVALSGTTIVLIIFAFVCYSVLISACTIILTSKTKSFKEAQNSIQPLTFITMIPMFLSIMGTKLTMTLALVPFLNISLLLTDILKGTVNMQYYLVMVISTIAISTFVIKAIAKLYKSDKILFS